MSDIETTGANALFAHWSGPFGLPPFNRVKAEDFEPALVVALQRHLDEIESICTSTVSATFDNTVAALDQSGRSLVRIALMFGHLIGTCNEPSMQAAERAMAKRFAAHEGAVRMNQRLFDRIHEVYLARDLGDLDEESRRLIERVHLDFVMSGAQLEGAARENYTAASKELAELFIRFNQNLLTGDGVWTLPLDGERDLDGLPDHLREATRSAARERGLGEDAHAITLSASLAEQFLIYSRRRELREAIWKARFLRGAQPGPHDNRPIAARILALRQEQASILDYSNYAEYVMKDRMAESPNAVSHLLRRVWDSALSKASDDRAKLTAIAQRDAEPTPLAPWDWNFFAEKFRQEEFDFDQEEIRPYLSLDSMVAAMFYCASRLFKVEFQEHQGLNLHHPDARIWEVRYQAGGHIGVLIADFFARRHKRGGAWMNVLRSQSAFQGGTTPVVCLNTNFARSSPTLLSFDDIKALFHEFGHSLHALLSRVRYERLSGTKVVRDYVELPSQIFENWALQPQVLEKYALHFQTGEPAPTRVLERLSRALRFNQAWTTVQQVGPSLIDLELHSLAPGTEVQIEEFEKAQSSSLGVPPDIGLRHRLPHFVHVFGGSSYAAGYYSYIWADVLAADAFAAFAELDDPFDEETARRLLEEIYSTGNKRDPAEAYRRFRGRDPIVEPMLVKRGLSTPR